MGDQAKHTPGPWQIDRNNVHTGQIATIHHCINNDWIEIWSPTWPDSEEQQEANARLIATSPELLAELEWFTDPTDEPGSPEWNRHVKLSRAAIARARGV